MIRIIGDSASDITQAEAKELGIDILPLTTRFGEEEYRDGVDIDADTFYEKLVSTEEIPQTSMIPPIEYDKIYSKYDGDDIVVITISSKLSGCFQSARLMGNEHKNVYVVDSRSVTITEGNLVRYAIELRDKGLSAKEIYEILEEKKKNLRLFAAFDTLKYLEKGGRISSVAAAFGKLASIKPIVSIEDGEMKVAAKARGVKGARETLDKLIKESGEIDYDMPLYFGYTGNDTSLLEAFREEYPEYKDIVVRRVGAVVGTHAGPGCYGFMYFVK
ncbi:MAG: DegV family protein [Erysipelotrichaceae bacterium]|nr:DegV family protein [Erysipelotrichaceae bacterium]